MAGCSVFFCDCHGPRGAQSGDVACSLGGVWVSRWKDLSREEGANMTAAHPRQHQRLTPVDVWVDPEFQPCVDEPKAEQSVHG